MRLPSPAEALRALDLTEAGNSGLEALPETFSGEFCSAPQSSLGRIHLHHRDKGGSTRMLSRVIDGGTPAPPGFAFRLVLSHAPSTQEAR